MSKTKKRVALSCVFLCMIFLLLCALCLFVGCERDYKFTFSYNLETREYTKGSNVELRVTITNDSGFTYSYYGGESDFRPHVYLYHQSDGVRYVMPMDIPDTDDMGRFGIENGQSSTRIIYFKIPSDAPLGDYNLKLSYKDSSEEYENVLTVIEGEYKFIFDYEFDATECIRGSHVQLATTVTNDSGFTYTYYGSSSSFMAGVYLYTKIDGRNYVLQYNPIALTDDLGWFQIENGQSGKQDYYFVIPSDAPLGEYNLKLSYKGILVEYENVLTINEGEFELTFDYELDVIECIRGSKIQLSIKLTNETEYAYTYYGGSLYFPTDVELYIEIDGVKYVIPSVTAKVPAYGQYQIGKGESMTQIFEIEIPFDAPLGEYSLILTYKDYFINYENSVEYENVLKVVE